MGPRPSDADAAHQSRDTTTIIAAAAVDTATGNQRDCTADGKRDWQDTFDWLLL